MWMFRPLYVSPHGRFAQTLDDSPHGRFTPITFCVVHYLQWQTGTSIHLCLQSMGSRHMSHPRVAEILCYVHKLLTSGLRIIFLWAPSHVGLAGNSAADTAAKAAEPVKPVSKLTLPHCDYHPQIKTHVLKQLMESRNSERTPCRWYDGEPYKGILPTTSGRNNNVPTLKWIYMTHGYLLKRDSPPQCN